MDPKVIVFGFLLQLSAFAFSHAFRHMKVPTIIVFSKLPDVIIPFLIWLLFKNWSFRDCLFSVGSFLICLPLVMKYKSDRNLHLLSAAGVCFFLVLQGGLSPWYMKDVSQNQVLWVSFTTALIAWRFLLSLFFTPMRQSVLKNMRHQNMPLLGLRAFLTLGAQASLVIALSYGQPVIAWPILNSTGLISIVLSSVVLREHATLREYAAVVLLLVLGTMKALS